MHFILTFKLLLINFFILSSASMSGLYIDNGLDQTVIQRYLSKEEKTEVEHEILSLLGLPDRPKSKRLVTPNNLDSSGSKFLLDVYSSLSDSSSRTGRSEFNISGKDLVAIDESDAIVSFKSHDRHMPTLRHRKGRWLWFDVSEVSPEATIVYAELRIYQLANTSLEEQLMSLSLYQLHDDQGDSELELITRANVTAGNHGWISLNVTSLLAKWVIQPGSNHGLYISIYTLSGLEVRPEDIGLVLSDEGDSQPFLVGFLQGTGEVGAGGTTRAPRVRRQARRRKNTPSYPSNPLTDWTQPQRSCQIQSLYVSFKDLNWQDWIIAPDGYAAFYCSGECNFPLNAHMNATNHAIVQTLVHLMNPLQVPKPCCAPTRLTPISVLYFLEDSNVILKKYKNMVVKSCGCH